MYFERIIHENYHKGVAHTAYSTPRLLNVLTDNEYMHHFTLGEFWSSGIAVACVCVCVCIDDMLVWARTRHHPFKPGSLNLNHMCKRIWLISLCYIGRLTLIFKVKFRPIRACLHHNSSSVQGRIIKFGPGCESLWLSSPLFWGLIEVDLQVKF